MAFVGSRSLGPHSPGTNPSLTITTGIHLSSGYLQIYNESKNGSGITLGAGNSSYLVNGSHLTVSNLGIGSGPLTLQNGLTVESSTADFSAAPLAGSGPVNIEFGSTVDVGTVRAGLNFHVDNGMLFLQGADPSAFGASITEGAQGKVVVTNAQSVAREIFHTATGTLDLLNKAGGVVEAIKFAAGSREYTSVGAGGQMDITTNAHAAHALPTTFTH